jgi:hypothetical protein
MDVIREDGTRKSAADTFEEGSEAIVKNEADVV